MTIFVFDYVYWVFIFVGMIKIREDTDFFLILIYMHPYFKYGLPNRK